MKPYRIVPSWDGELGDYDVVLAHDPDEVIHTGTLDECRAEYPDAPVEEREPTDDQLYNRHGMEGGIPYPTADLRDEHDPSL